MEKGLIHLYWGNGKGKTTAAMGVALRSLAAGKKVAVVQFLKGRESGEITLLSQLGARIYRGKTGDKFVFQMTEDEKAETRKLQEENLLAALQEPAEVQFHGGGVDPILQNQPPLFPDAAQIRADFGRIAIQRCAAGRKGHGQQKGALHQHQRHRQHIAKRRLFHPQSPSVHLGVL